MSQNRRHVFSRERATGASLSGNYGILYRPKIVLSRCVKCTVGVDVTLITLCIKV